MATGMTSADGAGKLDRAGVEEELLGQRRLAGVGVRDDRKGAPSRNFPLDLGQKGGCRGIL